MAKVKKETLTIDERLQQALVPESEQPYEVPGNWVWTRFKNARQDSESFFDGDWILSENMDVNGEVRLIQLSDIGIGEFLNKSSKYISIATFHELQCSELVEGDILISRMADPIARSCIMPKAEMKCITAVDVAVMRCNLAIINNKFLNWLCNTAWFTDFAGKQARGTTRVRITRKNLGDMPFPLPPLAEQRRIVAVIESLFEKLDKAKELAQSALDSSETRKAAILHKAFTGELTAKWREENGVKLEDWKKTLIGQICKLSSGGTPSRTNPDYYTGNIPWVKTGEINWNIILSTEEYITEDAMCNSSAKLFPAGTILVAMYGQGLTRGRAAILGIAATTNQAVCALIPSNKVINMYLYYYFECNYWSFREKAVGGNQPNFSGKMIAGFPIILPTLPEQQEIVRILDSLLENEQKAKDLCDVIEKIDLMKKAILARAFRGELGTNDPSEESALNLLKEVLAEQ